MFTVIINQPGYLPEVEPVDFETCAEAWSYVADEIDFVWDQAEASSDFDHDYQEALSSIHSHDMNSPGIVYAGGYAYCVEVAE